MEGFNKKTLARPPKKKPRTSENNTLTQPLANHTKRALELELELKATQKGVTKIELQELVLIEYLLRRGNTLRFVWDEINYIRSKHDRPHMSYNSFIMLRDRFPEYFSAMNNWIEDADQQVASALFSAAIGMRIQEEKAVVVSDGHQVGSHVEKIVLEKQLPPNVQAAQFWLQNRQPDKWSKKVELAFQAFSSMSDEELMELVKKQIEKTEQKGMENEEK